MTRSRPALARQVALAVAAAAILILPACDRPSPRDLVVSRVDVLVTLEDTVCARVDERWTIRARDGARAALFERRVPGDRVDEFVDVEATLDGDPVPVHAPRSSMFASPDLVVAWPLPTGSARDHIVQLRYRATGVFLQTGGRASLRWPTLPAPRPQIGMAQVRLVIAPALTPADPPGIAAAGWRAAWTATGITAENANVAPDDPGELVVELAAARPLVLAPRWQLDADRVGQLAPAFVSGALFLLVVAAGVLWMVRFYFRDARGAATDRAAVDRAFRTGGLIVIVLGAACAIVALYGVRRYGWWPMTMAVSVLISGAMFTWRGTRTLNPEP